MARIFEGGEFMVVSRHLCVLAIALGISFAVVPAFAAMCDEAEFKDTIKESNGDLMLNGLGLRKATFFEVKVYVVGLYLPEKSSDAGEILSTDQPWRLELRFVRGVGASNMKEAIHNGFESTGANLTPLDKRIDAFVGMLTDFTGGQTLSFTNEPETGVAVGLDGTAKGAIEGADFASTLLAIWLGPKPANEEMKTGLLGGACEW